jgi:hypothetical protein
MHACDRCVHPVRTSVALSLYCPRTRLLKTVRVTTDGPAFKATDEATRTDEARSSAGRIGAAHDVTVCDGSDALF